MKRRRSLPPQRKLEQADDMGKSADLGGSFGVSAQNMGHSSNYPLVNVYITNWKITMFNGKIHYFYGHFQ